MPCPRLPKPVYSPSTVGSIRDHWHVTVQSAPPRHQWLPWALPIMFGDELPLSDPWQGLRDAIDGFTSQAIAIRDQVLHDAAAVEGVAAAPLHAMRQSWTTFETMEAADTPMRVVLMGRTMAGKSSLLSALSGSHFERIGDGRQRFSRDVLSATPTASNRIEIVDTPGVGAADGAEDVEVAFGAAKDADLILWVASSDSIQQETADALRLLGAVGKPIMIALNCKQSLGGVGKLQLLRFPENVYGDRDGLVDEIKHHLAAAGVEPLDVIYVHALAAIEAMATREVDTELHAASRLDDLANALIREEAAHSESRRAIRLVDAQREQVEGLGGLLSQAAASLRAGAEHGRRMGSDADARLVRIVRSAGEDMAADIDAAVRRRRDWHLHVTDFSSSLERAWQQEVSALQSELNRALDDRFSQLTADVESTVTDTEVEWATVSPDQFALRDLRGFGLVWGNRLARAGLGIGGTLAAGAAGLKLGALIGGAIGLTGGPLAAVTAAVGAGLGLGVGLALPHLKNLVDFVFLGEAGVLEKRRAQVAEKVGPILDDITHEYEKVIDDQLDQLRESLANIRAGTEERSRTLDGLADRWEDQAEALGALIQELDSATTSTLLRIAGRERLARSLRRATRVPGVCILAEFEDSAFWEAWLYPPDIAEKLAGGKVAEANGKSGSAITYALGLVDGPARLVRANSASATVSVHSDVASQIADTWADALTSHLDRQIQFHTTRRVSSQ